MPVEAARQATNEFLESVMESATNAIFVLDSGYHFRLVSRAGGHLTGFHEDELINQPFTVLFPPTDHTRIERQLVKTAVMGKNIEQYETRILRKDGQCVSIVLGLSRLQELGQTVGLVAVAEDITRLKSLQYELNQAQHTRSIGQLACGLAHEINTPAQYILSNATFLQESMNDILRLLGHYEQLVQHLAQGEEVDSLLCDLAAYRQQINMDFLREELPQAIGQSHEGIYQVVRVVEALKQFAQPGEDRFLEANLNRAIENTVTVAQNTWKQVADIKLELDPSLPWVICRVSDFNQVMLNLIINAADAIAQVIPNRQEKGVITIGTRREREWAVITVTDTGAGIPEAFRDRIFDPFFSSKGVGHGFGMGLSTCQSVVVRDHGGSIRFETETGKGTTFWVRLPVKPKSTVEDLVHVGQEKYTVC